MAHFKSNSLIVALLFIVVAESAHFEYCNQGDWIEEFRDCGANHQSPIELNVKDVRYLDNLPALKFINYNTPYDIPATIQNNGHTVTIQLGRVRDLPYITGGALFPQSRYVLDNIHFHWGSSNSHGSEHVINGKRSSMEMHILHRNSRYQTLEEAINYFDGLAAVGFLFDVSETFESRGLVRVIDALHQMQPSNYNESISIRNFKLSELIGDVKNYDFYTYSGSLTIPPCSEIVRWHVMDSVVKMSNSQIEAFRALRGVDGAKLDNNYRNLQVKGNREIRMHKSRHFNSIDFGSPFTVEELH